MRTNRLPKGRAKQLVAFSVIFLSVLTASTMAKGSNAGYQRDHHRQYQGYHSSRPLILRDQGSFFVGGETKHRQDSSDITIHQMYVQYEIPPGSDNHFPVVMLHGCCLSGKTWETTPDGRMGWKQYFVRHGYPVYEPDQVSRARSGFDATPFNRVKAGDAPPSSQPEILQASHQFAWSVFRFGPTFNKPFKDLQFPIEAVNNLYKQMIPDINSGLPTPNPTYKALSDLAKQLHGAVLMGHSESGFYPERAALTDPSGVRGIITIETGCDTSDTQEQISTLAQIPILVVFGDHLSDFPNWESNFKSCQTFIQQVNAAGGNATMIHLPDYGIYGNSHMLMQAKNNLQIGDLIIHWIAVNVRYHRASNGNASQPSANQDKASEQQD